MSVLESVGTTAMKTSCDRETLLRHLQVVGRGVSSRTSIQVLAGIMLAARDGELFMSATDMELSVRTRVPATVDTEGVVVVPGKLLIDIVRLLGDETVTLTLDDRMLVVTSGDSEYRLNTFDADDFPQLPPTGGELFSIDSESFIETVQSVSRAASQDESRPVLTGVNMHISSEALTMVATDSYRLSVRTSAITVELAEAIEAIVPARALDELTRIADQSPATSIAIGAADNQMIFGIDDAWITTRLIEGQFPNHEQLIPSTFEAVAKVDRLELLDVTNRTRLLAQRNSPLKLDFAAGTLTVSASTQDIGAVTESIPVDYDGEPMSIGFNADFMRDGVQSVEGDVLSIQLISPLRPGLLVGENESFSYLIMPVRLPE